MTQCYCFYLHKTVNLIIFKERFSEQNPCRPTLDGIQFSSLGQGQKESLVARFSEVEIKSAVWACGGDKSPGPDGLYFNFIKQFWEILKPDFIRFFDEFFINGIFPKGSNASFIALIPKIINPQSLNDYRPYFLELQLQLMLESSIYPENFLVGFRAQDQLC